MGESRFLLINFAVVIVLVILFLRGNKKPKPSSLRLGIVKLPAKPRFPERSLNCLFQYNGHTWDAHEILGVPAGCPSETIQKGFEAALRMAKDEQSKTFINAAFQALRDQGQV